MLFDGFGEHVKVTKDTYALQFNHKIATKLDIKYSELKLNR